MVNIVLNEWINDVPAQKYIGYWEKKKRKKCFYLMMHSTHFIYGYGYMASDIW